jgi:hypothetical protein
MKIAFVSDELLPLDSYITTSENVIENFLRKFTELGYKTYFFYIDRDHLEEEFLNLREHNLKNKVTFYKKFKYKIIKESEIQKQISKICNEEKINSYFVFSKCIDFIKLDKKDKKNICMWGMHDDLYPGQVAVYCEKNIIKKIIRFFIYTIKSYKFFFLNINRYKKASLVLQPGHYYGKKWKKYLKNKKRIIVIPQSTKDNYNAVRKDIKPIFFIKDKINILLAGMPNASLSKGNIFYLTEKIFPLMENNNILDHFRFHIIGYLENNSLSPLVKACIQKWEKIIKFQGYIDNFYSAVFHADAIVQICPIVPTIGTRIYEHSSAAPLYILHKNAELIYPELKNNIHCLLGQSANDFLKIFTNLYKKNIETAVLKKNLRNLYLSNWNQKKYDIFLNEVLNDFYSKHNVKNYYSFEIK